MWRDLTEEDSESQWQGFSDLFMTLFIIAMVMFAASLYLLSPKTLFEEEKALVVAVGGLELKKIRKPVNEMKVALGDQMLVRGTQPPLEVVEALQDTADQVVERLRKDKLFEKRYEALKASEEKLRSRLEKIEGKNKALASKYQFLLEENGELKKVINDKPPIIKIEEGGKKFRFPSGGALISSAYFRKLTSNEFEAIATEVVRRSEQKLFAVDTILVIGHTDSVSVGTKGNLDTRLMDVLQGERGVGGLTAGSNVDLGLMRAIAVRKAWQRFIRSHPKHNLLKPITVRCLSAGQAEPPFDPQALKRGETGDGSDSQKARRVEIRLLRN